MDIKVPWSGRGHDYTQREIDVVVEAMKKADPLTQGSHQLAFQEKFVKKFGVASAFAVHTCASALELSALLCRLNPGDEVIIPAHTFAVSAYPFARRGAKLVWADIDPQSFLVTRKTIEPLITAKTKAIVLVHLYGAVCEMDPILALAKERNLLIVEDAAQAIGASYKGRYAGSFGDFSCFSFHSHKNLTTLGEGGMFCVRDKDLQQVVPGFRHNGMRPFDRPAGTDYWKPAMSNVDFDWDGEWPYNYCLSEVQCALGSALLDRLDQMNGEREARAQFIQNELAQFEELSFQKISENCKSAWHLLPARFNGRGSATRDDLMRLLFHEYGIKTVVQYYPLYRYDMFKKAGFGNASCPETDRFYDNMISFPFTHGLSRDQLSYMAESIKKALKHLRK